MIRVILVKKLEKKAKMKKCYKITVSSIKLSSRKKKFIKNLRTKEKNDKKKHF